MAKMGCKNWEEGLRRTSSGCGGFGALGWTRILLLEDSIILSLAILEWIFLY